jgi:CRP/FNR family transcriptional regulator
MGIDPRIQKLASEGFLSCLDPTRRDALVDAGHLVELIRGQPLGPSVHEGCILLMLTGLLRVFLQSPAGRQVTVRYARPGEALGLVHLFGMKTAVHGQAIDAATLWSLPGEPIRQLALADARFALAIASECADRTVDAMEELRLVTFGSVRQRLARHLLDLASADERGTLVANVTQQELADAAGTVREVVARTLKEMRSAGLIGEAEGRIALLDTPRLDDEAAGRVT